MLTESAEALALPGKTLALYIIYLSSSFPLNSGAFLALGPNEIENLKSVYQSYSVYFCFKTENPNVIINWLCFLKYVHRMFITCVWSRNDMHTEFPSIFMAIDQQNQMLPISVRDNKCPVPQS